jgi:hypothetical protein
MTDEETTLLASAERFYEDNAKLCDDLAAELVSAGAPQDALDELIHESAENDGRDSDEASSVNNQGLALQVASLLEGNGIEEGTRIVRGAIPAAAPKA